jgi:hypothetical protein
VTGEAESIKRFSPEFLDEIQARIPVSEVVGRKVKLRKSGREWRGLSPFNKEETASFFVNDQKMSWFDFSSGENGNIFDFLIATEGLSFAEAVERLAAQAGLPIPHAPRVNENGRAISRADLRAWLKQQPYQVSIVYAARAALRALPELATVLGPRGGGVRELGSSILLPCFRAVGAAWAISRLPTRAADLRSAAGSAAEAAFAAANRIGQFPASSACVAAGRAAAAAARAATNSHEDATAAALALEAALAKARKEYAPYTETEFVGAVADMKAFEQGSAPDEISASELWSDGLPPSVKSEWYKLETALLRANENWEVWTEWYLARVRGRPISESLEIARAKVPIDTWAQGPQIVNKQIKRLIQDDEARRANPQPLPLDNVLSPFCFQVSERATIALAPNSANWPSFPHVRSKQDHAARLDVCRTLAEDLVSDLEANKYQARRDYAESLKRYKSRLPNGPGEGNILLADAEARTLRNLFSAEADTLSVALSSHLKTFLEQHMGLRVFYPGIANFYRDVRSGRIEEPLPTDAVDGILSGINSNTPSVFERSVRQAIEGSAEPPPAHLTAPNKKLHPVDENYPIPPADPLGEIDPRKASDFTFAGATNSLWRAFLEGEKAHKALEGWKKAGAALRPHVNDVLEWLNRFMGSGGGDPPVPPGIG